MQSATKDSTQVFQKFFIENNDVLLSVFVVMILFYIFVKGTSSLAVMVFSFYPRYFTPFLVLM